MEFHDYAAQETSGLVARLTGRAGASAQHLHAMREALDAALRAVDATPEIEGDVAAVAGRLNQAVEEAEQYVQRALTLLETLPAGPAREGLEELARYIVTREY